MGLLRGRVRAPRRRMCCFLWLLLLAIALAALGLSSELVYRDQNNSHHQHHPHRQRAPSLYPGGGGDRPHNQRIHPEPPDLEVIVDSRDPAASKVRTGLLSPLTSLREDQLLFVPAASAQQQQQGSKNPPVPPPPPQRKGSYKMLMPGPNKDTTTTTTAPTTPLTRGAMGKAVRLIQAQEAGLEEEEDMMELAAVQKYGFNEVISERISLHRGLPEARHPACLGEQYSESLPSASVVICFHDEAWSTLLRTVHSVLDTVPRQYLHEVLLVDDLSQHGHLKSVLSEYVAHLDGVRLIRSTRRLGIAGCRLLGAARAAGEVLVFMDSHCECHRGWLEPLLERVAQDRTRVVSPVIDVIDWQTFQYNLTQWPVRGVFDWRLDFRWESFPRSQNADQDDSAIKPVRSPALGGGVLVIDRHFFQSVGAYDPGMLLRGAEQIELSIRVWLCGGSMEVVPCSRVAHLHHRHLPPTPLADQELLQKNKIRVADTWMDSYGKIYYRRDTLAHFIRQSESPNITERVRLKRRLGCRTFHWFLTTVYPELYIPQDRTALSGELYNVGTSYCADYPRGRGLQGGGMNIAPCSGTGNQHCELNSLGEVRWGPTGILCLDADRGDGVVLSPCTAPQPNISALQWKFVKLSGQLVHLQSQLCLEAVKKEAAPQAERGHGRGGNGTKTEETTGLFLRSCSHHSRQQWHFEQLVAPKFA